MGDREQCRDCDYKIRALDQRIDQRIVDMEKRLDERYVNQKDYNTLHNQLQRRMDEQVKEYIPRDMYSVDRDSNKDRFAKLERMSWLGGIIGGFVGAVIVGGIIAVITSLLR